MAFSNLHGIEYKYPIQNTKQINLEYKDKFIENLCEILDTGNFILGKKVDEFEKRFANYVGTSYCLSTSSGSTALEIAMLILPLSENDEIIIQGNTFISTTCATKFTKCKIVPIDVDNNGLFDIELLKKSINSNTKCVMVTHLYGDCCDMEELKNICNNNNIFLVEDCAQAHGTKYKEKMIGSFGDLGCFSFYPSKNLGALGDAGCVCTNNQDFYEKMRRMRNLGAVIRYQHEVKGCNYKSDPLQCSFILTKIGDMDKTIKKRRENAETYLSFLDKSKFIHIKNNDENVFHTYHLFVIKLINIDRKKFIHYLAENGIEGMTHYPVPFYKSQAYNELNHITLNITENLADTILSLPMDHLLSKYDIEFICNVMNKFE